MRAQTAVYRSVMHGLLRLYALREASAAAVYGRALAKALEELGCRVSPSTLYPILDGLEQDGLLESEVEVVRGRARRYYRITAEGEVVAAAIGEQVSPLVSHLFAASPN